MDDAVRAALARWPGVPEVFGWLRLDARGRWLTRAPDFAASGRFDAIGHPGFIAFIGRNYECDAHGRWYFQNGPQRVFVGLEVAPWVLRMDDDGGLVTHTGRRVACVEAAHLDELHVPLLVTEHGAGALDDRDLERFLARLVDSDGAGWDDARIERWLAGAAEGADGASAAAAPPRFAHAGRCLPIGRARRAALAASLGYALEPMR